MSLPPHTGDARAVRIGAAGASVSGALFVLALVALLVLVARLLENVTPPPDGSDTVIAVVLGALSVLGLVVLPVTGYVAASGAPTRPVRSGVVAAGTASALFLLLCLGAGWLILDWTGQFLTVLLGTVLQTALTAGLVLLGTAAGVYRWRRAAGRSMSATVS